ncbi:PKD domain-containing protein [Aridibaculum aurantiacum]|uniref:DUF7948 domain-containing protein n=1 Tax=Aridibaculum aurantiacum TaxID=2810307 RepID=UPI001A967814|nr:PKD domain-containing protein [Aridibaculum aurantiacum]
MKHRVSLALVVAFICLQFTSLAQYANLEFIENKGQWDSKVKFKGSIANGGFFLEENGFTVVKENDEDMERVGEYFHGHSHAAARKAPPATSEKELNVRAHAYKVQFVNAGNPTIVPDKPLDTYNNYFIGSDASKWATNCRIYQGITYQEIYPGVDVRYYTSEGKLKYDIIVKKGANLARIAMKYDGVDGLSVKNEELIIKTSVGEMRELAPYAFQVINGVKQEVKCRFKVAGKQVQFAVENYNRNEPLIIDPVLIFSTFSGSTADNWGYTATYGNDGTFYAGGIVFGSGFPTSPGAYQVNYGGGTTSNSLAGFDIGIMKFSANGTQRLYGTYLGGTGNEQPTSLIVDGQGNLVIGGNTTSANYPTTGPVIGPGGDWDIFITKLNASGTNLVGSRKIGGSGRDGVNIRPKSEPPLGAASIRRNYGDDSRSEVMLDGSNNIILVSNTQSGNFPVTPGVFQSTFGGAQDAVVIKMTPNVDNVLFSSFLGGAGDDAAFVVAIHPINGNLYVGGNTTSISDLPGDKTGVLYPGFQGGVTDGFVSIVNPAGTSLIRTTYIGTTGNDMLYGIQFDNRGFPYIMGTTTGTWPILNAAFSQAGGKQFISKLQPDLSGYVYSTVFGTNSPTPNLSPTAMLVDRCENVYVSGWGGSINDAAGTYPNSGTTGLQTTQDALPYPRADRISDGSDFYFFVLEKNATRQLYGSFFGQFGGSGEHVDGGTSRFDRQGIIYQSLCANCGRNASFPTTPGAWAATNGSNNCNLAAVKIEFDFAGIANTIESSINGVRGDSSGCVPLRVRFEDLNAEGQSYRWDFGDNTPEVTTTVPSVEHIYNAVGDYRVRLISIDSNSCNISDTSYQWIRVREDIATPNFNFSKVGGCASTTYQFNNTSTSATGRPFTNTSFQWFFDDGTPPVTTGTASINHTFAGPGTYRVKLVVVDTAFCNAPDSIIQNVRIAANVRASVRNVDSSACAPHTITFDNNSQGGESFEWDFGDGTTSTEQSPTKTYTIPGTYNITLVATDNSTCNVTDTLRFRIVISGSPTASFVYTPVPPRENTPVEFFNNSTGASSYRWEFGDGEVLETTSTNPISHIFNETRTYQTCLIAINQYGCRDTICQPIQARVIPLLDVPNAFTPNGDGVNDKVFVRGFGIAKMNWRIYNRWGTVVFQTNNRTEGWDGTYRGAKQPKEVYHYVLDVEFSDGKKYQKKGDITLL